MRRRLQRQKRPSFPLRVLGRRRGLWGLWGLRWRAGACRAERDIGGVVHALESEKPVYQRFFDADALTEGLPVLLLLLPWR